MRISCLILFACLLTIGTQAQDFLVTSKGDTIRGEIKPLSYGVDKKVQVVGPDRKKTTYPMFQVRTYKLKDAYYQPVKGPDGYSFMKVIRSGYLSLFAYQLPNQVTYDGQFLQKRDGRGMEIPNLTFEKSMKNFLEDCPTVVDRIENDELNKKDLLQIVDEYNDCIQGRTAAHERVVAQKVVAEKKLSSWDVLEDKVKNAADFESKATALEMIQDIKGRIARSEKIPNFVLDGLKNALSQEAFKAPLEAALKDLN